MNRPISFKVPLKSWWRFSLRERISLLHLLADPPPPNPTADHIPAPPTQAQQDAKHINDANVLDMVVTLLWKVMLVELMFIFEKKHRFW